LKTLIAIYRALGVANCHFLLSPQLSKFTPILIVEIICLFFLALDANG